MRSYRTFDGIWCFLKVPNILGKLSFRLSCLKDCIKWRPRLFHSKCCTSEKASYHLWYQYFLQLKYQRYLELAADSLVITISKKKDFQMRYDVFLMYNITCGLGKSTTLDFPVCMWLLYLSFSKNSYLRTFPHRFHSSVFRLLQMIPQYFPLDIYHQKDCFLLFSCIIYPQFSRQSSMR